MTDYAPTLTDVPESVIEIVAYATGATPDARLVYIRPDTRGYIIAFHVDTPDMTPPYTGGIFVSYMVSHSVFDSGDSAWIVQFVADYAQRVYQSEVERKLKEMRESL